MDEAQVRFTYWQVQRTGLKKLAGCMWHLGCSLPMSAWLNETWEEIVCLCTNLVMCTQFWWMTNFWVNTNKAVVQEWVCDLLMTTLCVFWLRLFFSFFPSCPLKQPWSVVLALCSHFCPWMCGLHKNKQTFVNQTTKTNNCWSWKRKRKP